ncbi:MAG TPA: iron ABC transporter permease [Candidatus Sulfomarinibacteraceae bacterium]|nr:iron ABC transporter permease [Candidatus Sulfomarinibacteraceae bacterium]
MSVRPMVTQRARRQGLPLPDVGSRLGWKPQWQLSSLLLLLAALAVGAAMLLPPAYLLVRAAGAGQAALEILVKGTTVTAFVNTVFLAGSVTLASALLAVPLAYLTVATDLPGRRFWSVAAALPLVLPSYVAAYLIASILGPRGLLQQGLEPLLGIVRLPTIYGFPGAFLSLTLMSYPYTFLSVRAALKRMDPALVEAARSLGHTPWQAFRRITLPHLRPALVAGSLLVCLYVVRDFGAVSLMRYDTFTRIIYVQYRSFLDRSLAASLALVLIAMTAAILYFELRTRGRAAYARRSVGAARRATPVKLGRWRWPALIFMGSVVFGALVLPAGGLLYWLVRGLESGPALAGLWSAAWNSLSVSLAAAFIAIAAALPVAILSVRRPGHLSQLLERLTYVGFALPGIVIALALVFFGASYAPSIYQTLPLLLAGYVILFIPQAVGSTRASLLQVPASLEEAGRSLGQSQSTVLRKITIPLLRPGLVAGAGLVFLTCMKELPATLLLSPLGFRTLATGVWGSISEAFFAQAAAPALLLVLLSSVPLAILTLRED